MPEETHYEGPRIFEPLGAKERSRRQNLIVNSRCGHQPEPRGRPTGGGTADLFGNALIPSDRQIPHAARAAFREDSWIPGARGSGVAGEGIGVNSLMTITIRPT